MSARPVLVLSADWHLQEYAWARHPDLAGDAYFGLSQTVDLCIRRGLFLAGLGDLFDSRRPSAKDVWTARYHLDRLADNDLYAYLLRGNHDLTDPPWLENTNGHVRYVGQRKFPHHGLSFFGLDYTPADRLSEALKGQSGDVLLCHQAWQEFSGGRSDGTLASLSGFRCVASGDLHQTIVRTLVNADGQPMTALSPGALCMQAIDEPDEHCVFILYDDLSVEKVVLKSRKVLRYDVADDLSLQEVLGDLSRELSTGSDLPPEISRPIVDVKLGPGLAEAHELLRHETAGHAHLFVRPLDQREPVTRVVEVQVVQESCGLLESLAEDLPREGRAYAHGVRLLGAGDPVAALSEIEAEVVADKERGIACA